MDWQRRVQDPEQISGSIIHDWLKEIVYTQREGFGTRGIRNLLWFSQNMSNSGMVWKFFIQSKKLNKKPVRGRIFELVHRAGSGRLPEEQMATISPEI